MSQPQPTFAYTTETTEFDDALIQRGIVTRQQALVAKGMTPQQAESLLQQEHEEKLEKQRQQEQLPHWNDDSNKHQEDSDDDDSFLDDDDFMQQYRAKRMQELQQKYQRNVFGDVIPISRPEWQRHVNEASQDGTWVIVVLTSTDTERTGCVEQAVHQLAPVCPQIKFVTIPAAHALSGGNSNNDLDQLLPTVFCYRHGSLQHQLSQPQLPVKVSMEALQGLLTEIGVGN